MSHRAKKAIWVKYFLNKLISKQAIRKMKMLSNNKMSFTLTSDVKNQNCNKYINVMHYYMQGLVKNIELEIE